MPKAMQILSVWLALMALLAATVVSSMLLRGSVGLAASLVIALAKAALVFWFFMHLREENGLARIAATGAVLWVAILFLLSGLDIVTRGL
ncbi:cytochrome C oxidase subunit IV family protein [Rhizobium sp. YJ-22]|uniref:cytochrome C oxidase subunit IV family protein n=1 Tax=Rhizobium sp. YJ-22 TaxID=3037556 RepID=UPI0024123FC1|nr:cytochrome C oxidase subunit IV family protein [Rhizobium sp. YJ-22]MDG3579631.1 cytochrome C oxidase subunit IV family protein [Rhizobium sp. YJ-22]